jgi:hypothetical protein
VLGIEPKSCGKFIPTGNMRLTRKMWSLESYLYLLRLPAGVSIITWIRVDPGSRAGSNSAGLTLETAFMRCVRQLSSANRMGKCREDGGNYRACLTLHARRQRRANPVAE